MPNHVHRILRRPGVSDAARNASPSEPCAPASAAPNRAHRTTRRTGYLVHCHRNLKIGSLHDGFRRANSRFAGSILVAVALGTESDSMTIPKSAKLLIRWFARVLLVVAMFWAFFLWAPWLACKPISEISTENLTVSEIPAYAKCYTIEHGQIYFSARPTISENPILFAFATTALVLLAALTLWSFYWGRNKA